MAETFVVPAKGIGRMDYSSAIERATQPFVTPALRQDRFAGAGSWILPVFPFPFAWASLLPMPQEDGTWDWPASTIPVHFFELNVSIKTNHLVTLGLLRYASIDDYIAGIIAERSPQIFSYNNAELTFLKGIPTQPGSLYAALAGGWPDTATFWMSLMATGIATELTPPWMPA